MLSMLMNKIFLNILSMSLSGALVGIVIMMVHPLTGKFFSKRWNYYIWLLVVIRLLLPAQLTMALPGGILIDASHMGVETKAETGEADLADGNLMYTEPASNPGTNAERASEQEAGRPTNPALNAERASEQEAGRSSNPGMNAEQTLKQEAGQVANSELNTEDNRSLYAGILFGAEIIWLTGLIAALGIRLWNYRRFVRAVRMNAVSISDGLWYLNTAYLQGFTCGRRRLYMRAPSCPVLSRSGCGSRLSFFLHRKKARIRRREHRLDKVVRRSII